MKRNDGEKGRASGAPSRRIALVILGAMLLFALYFLGVFDFALIERPSAWKDNTERFYSIWYGTPEEETAPPDDTASEDPGEKERPSPGVVSSVDLTVTGKAAHNGADYRTVFKTREELAEEGYYVTDSVYEPGVSVIGTINFSFDFPEEFSYRKMKTRTWKVTEYDNGDPSTVKETETSVPRPALYLYMGYIIYDDCGNDLYLLDRNGAVLMNYDPAFIPAFARDGDGRPLFYQSYGYYTDVPATDTVNEAGEHTFTYRGAYLTAKTYYTVGYGGGYFARSEYVEERDGRGLNFDYPARYGLCDNYYMYRVGIMSPKYSSFLKSDPALVNFMNWNYFSIYDPDVPDVAAIVEAEREYAFLSTSEKLAAIEAKTTPEDIYHTSELFPYTAAYNYNEGFATVVTPNVDEEPKYEVSELRVINTSGNVMFNSRKKYVDNTTSAYCSDRYLLPLSKGEDSVGHLYFDRGYMRLRKQTFDKFQLDEYGDFKVASDKDVLVTPYGREFDIPEGYKLTGYANGVLTLERKGLYGYMRTDGTWIAEPKYKQASAFHGGLGVLTMDDGYTFAVDTNGTVVIPAKYKYISLRSDELIAAYSEYDGWVLYGVFSKQ